MGWGGVGEGLGRGWEEGRGEGGRGIEVMAELREGIGVMEEQIRGGVGVGEGSYNKGRVI